MGGNGTHRRQCARDAIAVRPAFRRSGSAAQSTQGESRAATSLTAARGGYTIRRLSPLLDPPPPDPPPPALALSTAPAEPLALTRRARRRPIRHWLGFRNAVEFLGVSPKSAKELAVCSRPSTGLHVVSAEGCAKRRASASYSEVQSLAVLRPLLQQPSKDDFERQWRRRYPGSPDVPLAEIVLDAISRTQFGQEPRRFIACRAVGQSKKDLLRRRRWATLRFGLPSRTPEEPFTKCSTNAVLSLRVPAFVRCRWLDGV